MTDLAIQNNLQHAARRVSQAQQIADAVIAAAGDQYLRVSELILAPAVYALVKDANSLSVALSAAYKQGLLGRKFDPLGHERFGYGAKGERAAGVTPNRKVIKGVEKVVTGYEIRVVCRQPIEVLRLLEANPGSTHASGADEWIVTIPFADKDALLACILAGGFLSTGVEVVTLRG